MDSHSRTRGVQNNDTKGLCTCQCYCPPSSESVYGSIKIFQYSSCCLCCIHPCTLPQCADRVTQIDGQGRGRGSIRLFNVPFYLPAEWNFKNHVHLLFWDWIERLLRQQWIQFVCKLTRSSSMLFTTSETIIIRTFRDGHLDFHTAPELWKLTPFHSISRKTEAKTRVRLKT